MAKFSEGYHLVCVCRLRLKVSTIVGEKSLLKQLYQLTSDLIRIILYRTSQILPYAKEFFCIYDAPLLQLLLLLISSLC